MIDDRTLVSRILTGDTNAFRTLIRQNERLVAHMVGRLVDRAEDREELCQDVFLRVHDRIGTFQFQSRLSTWIATIAYNAALNYLRKKKVAIDRISDETLMVGAPDPGPDEIVGENDMQTYVLKLIGLLPVHYKTVITLYHVESMNYDEIGQITGMPEGTVKNYLFRARKLLKEKVKKYLGNEDIL